MYHKTSGVRYGVEWTGVEWKVPSRKARSRVVGGSENGKSTGRPVLHSARCLGVVTMASGLLVLCRIYLK